MPSCARRLVVDENEVGTYHVYGRCVRRAWLCGVDPLTGKDYEYRRRWIWETEEAFAALFAVEIGFRTEMGNHLHMVIRNRPDIVATWSDEEVVRRILTIDKRTHNLEGELEEPAPNEVRIAVNDPGLVADYRKRLASPSWFMKAVRENIARRANREDGVGGAFWDGRYKCRKLLDEAAIIICGIYVDLNQIRAGETLTPETSIHTSAFDRIQGHNLRKLRSAQSQQGDDVGLISPDGWMTELTIDEQHAGEQERGLRSRTGRRASDKGIIPMSFERYLELLDWTGRQVRSDKPGAIPATLAPILERLQIRTERWIELVINFENWFGSFAGHIDRLIKNAAKIGRRLFRGVYPVAEAFLPTAADSS